MAGPNLQNYQDSCQGNYRLIFPKTSLFNIPPALVDISDYRYLLNFNWNITRKTGTENYYYHTRVESGVWMKMHRLLLKVTDPKVHVDHKNHITYDNRRANLRKSTNKLNAANRKKCSGKVPYKGVSKHEYGYYAWIKVDGKSIYLGNFKDPIDAALIYNHAAVKYFGEHAYLNKL